MKSEVDIFLIQCENLSNKLINIGSQLIIKSLKLIEEKDENFVNQNESELLMRQKLKNQKQK